MIFKRTFSSSSTLLKTSLTFFTKETCQLCTNARGILFQAIESNKLKDKKSIDLEIIDIMDPKNQKWFDVYCYDVPVLHILRENETKPTKFMHYFHEEKIVDELNK